ncbi:MAG: hypothetical protein KDA84_23355 [Planctomycetaceae bacterium]|nr:hypothetical protein [Planctomycetaceae bacterium]
MKSGEKAPLFLVALCGLGLVVGSWGICPSLANGADDEKATRQTHTFAGQWNNKKYGTSGPLKCVMTETAPNQWEAKFTGTFQNDPFDYDAKFQSKKVGKQLNVGGTAKIRGHDYQWTGTIKNGQLTAQYKSSVGYFGGFAMKKVKD